MARIDSTDSQMTDSEATSRICPAQGIICNTDRPDHAITGFTPRATPGAVVRIWRLPPGLNAGAGVGRLGGDRLAVGKHRYGLLGWILDSCSLCRLAFVLAKVKGHDQVEWAWYGFIFGLFGLLAAVGLPDHRVAPDTSTEPCPACGETLAKGYSKCRNCNEALMWHEGTPYSGSESEVRKQLSELAEAKRQQLQEETDERQPVFKPGEM